MEKEIYLTEAVYTTEINDTFTAGKQRTAGPTFSRPESAKLTNKRINTNFLQESYYDNKRVKPGIAIYKLILEIQQRRANYEYFGPHLKLPIPETVLLNDNSNSLIYTQDGIVKVQPFVSNQAFLKKIQDQRPDPIFPYVLHSTISGINFNESIMMNTEVIGNKIIPRSQGFICRKFIQPYAATPNILRLYYWSKSNRQLRKNYGYKFVHNKQMSDQMFRKKHRLLPNFIVNTEKEDTYKATLLAGKALDACVALADNFVEYFQKGIFVKVSQLVLDFIVDQNKQPWFYEVKSVRSTTLTKLWDIGSKQELQLLSDKNNSSHVCKLCGMAYTRQEMEKIVTNKLIWELICHLQARGVPFKAPPHLRKEGLSYICDICYDVVVAEHRLITVQREFSGLLNLSSNALDKIPSTQPSIEALIESSEQIPAESGFKAWRLFFYIERIKSFQNLRGNKNTTINLQMKFNNLKQQFTKVICGQSQEQSNFKSRFSSFARVQSAQQHRKTISKLDQSYLSRKQSQSRFQNNSKAVETMTTMASKVVNNNTLTRQTYSIEKVKVYVFYTKKSHTNNLFANTELQFSLNINDQRFNGRSATMQALKNRDTCQRHSSQIFLFDQNLKYCNLELTVGLICDGDVEPQGLELEGTDGIYFPKKGVPVCHPLPDQWMEVFTKGQSVPCHSKEMPDNEGKKQEPIKESRLKTEVRVHGIQQ